MNKQFLVTVETPGDVPADRLETIRGEIEQHAAACVEFYGRQRPDKVTCMLFRFLERNPNRSESMDPLCEHKTQVMRRQLNGEIWRVCCRCLSKRSVVIATDIELDRPFECQENYSTEL